MPTPQPPVVLGADGCRGGAWAVAEAGARGGVRWHVVPDAAALLRLADELAAAAVAVDVPIGLPADGVRPCDVEARRRLRGGGASSVFAAPPRRVLGAPTYAAGRALAPALSAQAFALVARIRDVDTALRRAGEGVHGRVVECHPEVVFRSLAGVPLPPKRSAPGALRRLALLEPLLGPLPPDAPAQAGLDDALDAAACAVTARRWARGEAEVLGGERDDAGVPMRIVV